MCAYAHECGVPERVHVRARAGAHLVLLDPHFIVVCGLWLHRIVWCLVNGKIFGKKLLNIKCVF